MRSLKMEHMAKSQKRFEALNYTLSAVINQQNKFVGILKAVVKL